MLELFFFAPIRGRYLQCDRWFNLSLPTTTILVLVQPFKVMEDHLVELYINLFRSQLIDLLLDPSLFENVHLLVQKLLDLQEEFNQFITFAEVLD